MEYTVKPEDTPPKILLETFHCDPLGDSLYRVTVDFVDGEGSHFTALFNLGPMGIFAKNSSMNNSFYHTYKTDVKLEANVVPDEKGRFIIVKKVGDKEYE